MLLHAARLTTSRRSQRDTLRSEHHSQEECLQIPFCEHYYYHYNYHYNYHH